MKLREKIGIFLILIPFIIAFGAFLFFGILGAMEGNPFILIALGLIISVTIGSYLLNIE